MPTTTTRLSLTQPIGIDPPSQLRTSITGHASTLDNAAIFLSGTLLSRPIASIQGRYYLATDDTSSGSSIGTLYFDTGAAWVSGFNPPSRGATNIAASESRTNVAYATLTTPDQVTGIVLPTNGLIAVWYQATWQASVTLAGSAAIFLGANQVQALASQSATSPTAAAAAATSPTSTNTAAPLASWPTGLLSGNQSSPYTGDVTTGQVVSASTSGFGGPCYIFAVAGTYTVSVQFKASSGSVTAANRKLWVQALPFSSIT